MPPTSGHRLRPPPLQTQKKKKIRLTKPSKSGTTEKNEITSKGEGGVIASEARTDAVDRCEARTGAVKHMQSRMFSYLGTKERKRKRKIVRFLFVLEESP